MIDEFGDYVNILSTTLNLKIMKKTQTVQDQVKKNLEHYSVLVNKTILQYQLPENGGFVIYGMWNFQIYVGQVLR
jgi:hypothetical protein